METGKGSKKKKKKSEPNIGFQFNAPVTAERQTFITGDVGTINQGLSADDLGKLDKLFQAFQEQVRQATPPDKQGQSEEQLQELHTELIKGEGASAERLNKIVDGLVEMVPGASGAVVSLFTSPTLGALVEPTTKVVLDHLKK